jgi:hypothetical protein
MSGTINTELVLDVEVEYTLLSRGYPAQGPTYSCGGQPAEPPEFQIDRVMLGGVNILNALSEDTLELLRDQVAEDYDAEPDRDYCDDDDY